MTDRTDTPSTDERPPLDTERSERRTVPAESDADSTHTLAQQGSIAFAGNLVKKVFGFLIVAVITRLVSPSVYGLFVLATSIIHFVQAFASLGLPKAVDYFVPQYLQSGERGKARAVVLEVTMLVLLTSGITALVIFLLADRIGAAFDEPSLAIALIVLTVTIPLLAIYNVLLASFNAIKRLQYRVYTRDIVRPTVRLAGTVGLLFLGYGLLGVVGGYVLGLVAAIVVGVVLLRRRVPELTEVRTESVAPQPLLWYSVPLAVAGVIYVVLGQVDYFVIGYFGSSEEVGIYRVGYMLAANLLIVFSSISPVFKPLIAERKDDDAAVQRRFRTAVRWVVALSLPLAITLALGAETYLSLVFTPQYAAATAAVAILCVGYLISVGCGGPDGALLQGMGYSRLVFANSVLLVVTNITVSVLLVPRIGITGAAIGTASALAVSGLAAVGEVYYFRRIHPLTRDLGKVFVAAVPAALAGGAVVVFVATPLAIAVGLPVVVLVVYGVGLSALDAPTAEDVAVAERFGPTAQRLVGLVRS